MYGGALRANADVARRRAGVLRKIGTPMAVFCALNCNTSVRLQVEDLGCGAGRIVCLECSGTGWWDFMEPEIPAYPCNDCKGSGFQLVSVA